MKAAPEIKPPRLATKLLTWYSNNSSIEDLHGDIDELFHQDLETLSPARAKLKYWQYTLSLILSYAIKKRKQNSAFPPFSYNPITPVMVKNYFTIAWRTICKNKVYSLINVLGLTLGVCACTTIFLVTRFEFSFDTFHPGGDRIYRIIGEAGQAPDKMLFNAVPAPAPAAIREEIAGLEVVTGFHMLNSNVRISDGNNPPKQFGRKNGAVIVAEPDYFSLFQYEWIAGNASTLNDPFKVVLSESRARSFFGSAAWDKIIGREVAYDDSLRVIVTGIVKDWEGNTDFPFTDFISFATIRQSFLRNGIHLENWYHTQHSSQGFVKLKAGDSPDSYKKLLTSLFKKYRTDNKEAALQVSLQPLNDIHFYPNDETFSSFLPTLYALMGLAAFILIIATINFINLSTAQSIRRSKEIGIRKVLGSLRLSLIAQFLTEAFLLTLIAVCLASLLIRPVLTGFNSYIPSGVRFDLFSTSTLLFLLLTIVVTSLLAGLYPAIMVSSYPPSVNLKPNQSGNSKQALRKGLVVFQFAIALFFIIGALTVGDQLRFIQTKDRGFNTQSVITLRTNWDDKSKRPRILVENIKRLSGVAGATLQGFPPMGFAAIMNQIVYRGQSPVETAVALKSGDEEFIPLYQIRLIAGRNISKSDTLREFAINEGYSKVLGFAKPENAIGQILFLNGKPFPIVGVVENFHQRSFHEPIMPCVIGTFAEFQHGIAIRLAPTVSAENEVIALRVQIEKLYKQLYPDEAFESHFIEDEIGWMHDGERKTANLVNAAMAITIFISCLGVFGLALFTAEIKTKEIGIRKVLGASVSSIVSLLSRDFIVLILIAMVIASPVAWYFTNQWLQGFAYRVDATVWIYVIAGLAALSIGLISMSFQTIKAARANPADSLRTE